MNRLICPLLLLIFGACTMGRQLPERTVYVPCIFIRWHNDTAICQCRDWAYHNPEDTASFSDQYFLYSKTQGRAVWLPKVVTD